MVSVTQTRDDFYPTNTTTGNSIGTWFTGDNYNYTTPIENYVYDLKSLQKSIKEKAKLKAKKNIKNGWDSSNQIAKRSFIVHNIKHVIRNALD